MMLTPGHVVQRVNPAENSKEIVTVMNNVVLDLYVERTIVFLSMKMQIQLLIQLQTVAYNLIKVRIMIKETILV